MQTQTVPAEPVKAIPIDMSRVVTHDADGVIIREGGTRRPGIYWNLPIDDYHADPALGSSNIKDLTIHPAEFWHRSWMNPNREDVDSLAKLKGRAFHKLVLEGATAFSKAYLCAPKLEDWTPRPLVTMDDMANFLKEAGKPHTAKSKAEMIKKVKEVSSETIIWDEHLATFNEMAAPDGIEVLKPAVYDEVKRAGEAITLNPHLARAFQNGASEVSVFWVDEFGIPCKCRFDYLKPRVIVDLKKFSNSRGVPMDVAIMLAIAAYRYDIQARHYLDGYRAFHAAAQEGRMFGDCPLPEGWQARISEPDAIAWTWIFHQMDGAPVSIGKSLTPDSGVLNRAVREIVAAKRTYLTCLEKFGTGMWVSDDPIRELVDTDLPVWMREEAEEYA